MIPDMFVVDYDPFAMDSRIVLIQNGQRSILKACSDLPELTKTLIAYSQEYNLYDMRINAPLNFFYELKRFTEQEEKNQYNENKIHMETC